MRIIPNKKNLWTLLFLLTWGVIAFAQASDPDLNNDGVVNILDVSLVGSCFGANLSVNPNCAVADTDGDGDVDMDDLNFVVSAFGQNGFPTEEPTCVADETCSTGEVGICSAGLTTCPDGPSGAPICQRTSDPMPEVCDDGLDNDCDGEVDDADVCAEPTCTVSEACSTGEPGVCSAGLTVCPDGPFGAPLCERTNNPVPEICSDGLDNDCDGEVDDADVCTPTCEVNLSCNTGEAGICSAGLTACPDGLFGAPVCEQTDDPVPEICGDNLDNDCDGEVDDADVCVPTCVAAETCSTGEVGICLAGLTACPDGPSGASVCERTNAPVAEICGDSLDNDCDGETDDADVCTQTCFIGVFCGTGESGVCSRGQTTCPDGPFGEPFCQRLTDPSPETCDGLDNNCDGAVDEGFDVGGVCDTGDLGICAPGVLACDSSGGTQCEADSAPQPEICNDGIDQDCDGSDCVLLSLDIQLPVANFVTAADSIDVSGTADASAVSVVVNGVDASLGGGAFVATVPLRSGPNMLVGITTDADGNTGTDSVLITRDIVAPNVQINSPPDGFQAIVDRVTVTGVVNDIVTGGVNPTVTVNGIEAFVDQGTFMVMDVPLVRGPNTITAIATDSVGNQDTTDIDVSFDPPAGAKLEPFSGDGQAALVGTTLAEPLVVRVVDNSGNPLASRVARFEVSRSDGILTGPFGQSGRIVEVPTDGSGLASVMFELGDRSGEGNNQVQVSSVGALGQAIFCATAQPALPDKILAVMGENQKGLAGSPLAEPFEILVVDKTGNPIGNMPVTYSVVAGGGNFDGQPTKTILVDADGVGRAVLTLGSQEGISNNIVEVDFDGNLGLPVTFIASGLVAGPPEDTRFAGVVLDNTNTPIPGALVHIEGSDGDVLTDDEGLFLLTGVPVGAVHLRIDASVSPRPQIFPVLQFEANTVAGRINRLPTGPARIPPLVSDVQLVGGAQDVVLQMPGVPGLNLTVFANSVTFPDGSSTGLVSINQVHLDKVPMPPPSGTIFMPPAWTVQPPGVHFDPPAKITIPNDGLPPGRVIDIFQFDHDLNRFVNVGPGTTDEEGLLIVSDPGFGITKSGWGGCGQPQPPTTCASSCDDGNRCTTDSCVNGSCVNTKINTSQTVANMCEGCVLGIPIPKKTDNQCCTSNPLPGAAGWVVCCNGVHTSCVSSTGMGGHADLIACIIDHEDRHHEDVTDCEDNCDTQGPLGAPPQEAKDSECEASKVEIACLQAVNCGGDATCENRIANRISQMRDYGNNNVPGCIP